MYKNLNVKIKKITANHRGTETQRAQRKTKKTRGRRFSQKKRILGIKVESWRKKEKKRKRRKI